MVMFSHLTHNAFLEPQDDTTHVVSMWWIPSGVGANLATVVNLFFSDKDEADKFALRRNHHEEMPVVVTYEEYLKTQQRIAQNVKDFGTELREEALFAVVSYRDLHPTDPHL